LGVGKKIAVVYNNGETVEMKPTKFPCKLKLFFTKLLRKCLENKRSATIYAILGMMIASIYSIVMGPTTLDIPKEFLNFETFSILFFIIGGIIILSLEGLKNLLNNKEN